MHELKPWNYRLKLEKKKKRKKKRRNQKRKKSDFKWEKKCLKHKE